MNRLDFIKSKEYGKLINLKMIVRILGILLFIEAAMFLLCFGVSLIYHESDYIYFIYSALINVVVGGLMLLIGRNAVNRLTRKDGYCIVAFTWLLFAGFGMLPFYMSGSIPGLTNAFFETMSGLTTTGASILDNIESLSHGILFWRSLTQWIGGLGIVFFTIAVLPIFGVGNQVLFSAEATGVNHDKIHPKISMMAKGLWMVYLFLTVVLFGLLLFGGMNVFDAVCHAFTTTATGGYSTKQNSIAYWNSPFIEYVIAIFMLLSSINYSVYFMVFKGKPFQWLKDVETKYFLGSVLTVTIMISLGLYAYNGYGVEESFRKALFQVASVHTSCGYITDDYNLWPQFTWLLIVYTMLAGGCTGSTAGGIKAMRISIILRNIKNEFNRMVHPRAVLPVKINKMTVSESTISTVTTFVMLYLMCLLVGWFILILCGVNFMESMMITVSSLGNVGPGLGEFGPTSSWNALPMMAKWVSSFLMLIGHLELFGILLIMTHYFWKKR